MQEFTTGLIFADNIPAQDVVHLARTADATGIGEIWIPENMFFRAPSPLAGALAGSTQRATIGIGVQTSFARHPALIAMEALSLAELAPGRVILGVGAGVSKRMERLGIEGRYPLEAIRDTVTIVRGLLRGDVVNHTGRVHQAIDLRLDASPVAEPPPIYIAAMGQRSVRQAGAIADGLILGVMTSAIRVGEALEIALDGARDTGVRRSSLPVVVYLPTSIDDDPAVARARLKPLMAFFVRRWVNVPSLEDMFTRWGTVTHADLEEMTSRLQSGEGPESVIPDELVTTYCLAGNMRECRDQIERYQAAGATSIAALVEPETPNLEGFIRQFPSLMNQELELV